MNVRHALPAIGLAAAIAAASGLPASTASAAVTFTPLALSGTDGPLGPNMGPGVMFTTLSGPSLNNTGGVVFGGAISGASGGIWKTTNGAGFNTNLVKTGDPAPSGGTIGTSFVFPTVNDAGQWV